MHYFTPFEVQWYSRCSICYNNIENSKSNHALQLRNPTRWVEFIPRYKTESIHVLSWPFAFTVKWTKNCFHTHYILYCDRNEHYLVIVRVMVFNATFNNISVISWWSVLLVEEAGVPGEHNSRPQVTWKTLSYYVVESTLRHERDSNSQW